MTALAYLRIWLASIRYSVMRTMMFRFDFLLWVVVDTLWMGVNLVLVEVIFQHVESIAGWSKHEMILLVGVSMLMMRLFMAFFLTNLFAIDRHVRDGTLDFFLAQPGNPLFMISTRKTDPDGLLNTAFAAGVIVYALHALGARPDAASIAAFVVMILLGVVIHYSSVVLLVALAFWTVRIQGVEMGYFSLFEVSRLPRRALRGVMEVAFVYAFPAVIVSNFPAETLLRGPDAVQLAWLAGIAALWFAVAVFTFDRGLRRYSSASS